MLLGHITEGEVDPATFKTLDDRPQTFAPAVFHPLDSMEGVFFKSIATENLQRAIFQP